ncbi:MAM and LDL-receptor class A domain-containing protein 1 [Elysia marginata]|uniref:MAM and LDL-receptor class A domain-containing protein 1 n=1 Tax=Elysia marginata TaxID=1093978 RepID=A0AAV4IN10_9GAST|nr:MAM and LDL-receptor class A domain-containing protein 1 [Elysia marginata]
MLAKDHQIDWTNAAPEHTPSRFDCNFRNMTLCEWEQVAGSDFELKVSQIGKDPNAWDPLTNHHGKVEGNTLGYSVEPEVGRGGVTSPEIPGTSSGHCLSFWYWLRGKGVSLRVSSLSQGQDSTLLWQRTVDEGRGWQWAKITTSDGNKIQYNITVEKLGPEGSVQLGDLWYSPRSCSPRQLSLTDTCDFETGLCGLTEPSVSNDSWTLVSGDWSSAVTWDKGDNTYKTAHGHFLAYSQDGTTPGSTAIMESPVMILQNDTTTMQETCVHFYYFLSGPHVGTLELTTHSTNSNENVVWKTSGDHGRLWLPGEIQLGYHQSPGMRFRVKAIAGPGPRGFFGIDDITVRQGKCASPGSCGFDNGDFCTWRPDPSIASSRSWRSFQGTSLSFEGDNQDKGILISQLFSGDQVRCIHFVWAHVKGKGSLKLSRKDIVTIESNQLLWKLTVDESKNTTDTLNWRPARVSVESGVNHEIYLTAEALSRGFHVLIDNVLVTSQPCLAQPAEAVSFDCDFSDGLAYWYQETAQEAYWVVKSEDAANKGPKVCAQVDSATAKDGATARLHSPVIPAGDRCLRFSYRMYGADVDSLKVFMDLGHKRLPYVDWRGGDSKNWVQTAINLKNDRNYKLVFEGVCIRKDYCDLRIANIDVSASSCPDTWHSGSDSPHCTFESDHDPLCQFIVRPSQALKALDPFRWRREGGIQKSYQYAPSLDVNLGASGHYAYVAWPRFQIYPETIINVTTTLLR